MPGEERNRRHGRSSIEALRALADQAFSRAAGTPLIQGNRVRLLRDAAENYPAWLAAIGAARRHVHFENFIVHADRTGEEFAEAWISKAREGVPVRIVYDWLGCLGKASRRFWGRLREAGVEVRCHNPPRLESPLGWLSRDHRKAIVVDDEIAFVSGLCVGRMWVGDARRGIDPWRDTGVELRGPAVAAVAGAFARLWATLGDPLPAAAPSRAPAAAGSVEVRIVATEPATAGMLRLDQMIAALARERVWLTDAYFAGSSASRQALCAAAREGVDVRLLVPGSTDLPLLRPLSLVGYRPLLEAGVRIFEWKGSMLHAKSAVADGRWARVGSTNLNLASWLGNYELDAVIEDASFAAEMEEAFLRDLENATEIVLEAGRRRRRPRDGQRSRRPLGRGRGRSGRAAAGALRIGNAIGAAFTNRRVLERVETRLMAGAGLAFLALALLFAIFPRALAYPLVALFAWAALALLYRALTLRR